MCASVSSEVLPPLFSSSSFVVSITVPISTSFSVSILSSVPLSIQWAFSGPLPSSVSVHPWLSVSGYISLHSILSAFPSVSSWWLFSSPFSFSVLSRAFLPLLLPTITSISHSIAIWISISSSWTFFLPLSFIPIIPFIFFILSVWTTTMFSLLLLASPSLSWWPILLLSSEYILKHSTWYPTQHNVMVYIQWL